MRAKDRQVSTLSIFVAPMSEEFDWSRTAISGAVSLGGLLGALVSPLIGPQADRHGARAVLTVGALIIATTCFALAGTQSLVWFYVAFAIGRLTFLAPFDIGLSVSIANWFIRGRARAMSLVSLAIGLSLAVMPLMGQLVMDDFGWRTAWVAIGASVIMIGALPVALFMIRRPEDVGLRPDGVAPENPAALTSLATPARPRDEVNYSLRQAARTPAFWLLMTYVALVFPVQAGISFHQMPHLVHRGMDPTVAATAISIMSVATAFGGLGFGYIGGRWPIRYGLALCGLLAAAGSVLVSVGTDVSGAYLGATVFGIGLGGLLTLSMVVFADYFGRANVGTIRGIVVPVQSIGQALGPIASGIVFDLTGGYELAFETFAVVAALASLLVLAAKPPRACGTSITLKEAGNV